LPSPTQSRLVASVLAHDKASLYQSAPDRFVKRDPWDAEEEGHLDNIVIFNKTIVK